MTSYNTGNGSWTSGHGGSGSGAVGTIASLCDEALAVEVML
jgi:hypothetical protein